MTTKETSEAAAGVGLVAERDSLSGFYVLRKPGRSMAARGGTWEEAFARFEESRDELEPVPVLVQHGLFDKLRGGAA